MIEIKKEIGFRFCDNSRILYASKDRDYMFLHPDIIDSELNKLEPYRPITYGKVLNLSSYETDFNPYTFIDTFGNIIGKEMYEYQSNIPFTIYKNADIAIITSETGDYLVINPPIQSIIFYACDYFAVSEKSKNDKTIYKIYNRNCDLVWVQDSYDALDRKMMSKNENGKFKKLGRKQSFNLYRQRLLETEKQLLKQKINRVIDLKNKGVVEGTFIDSIQVNDGEINLYAKNIKELEKATANYKRERIKKESV